MIFVVRNFEPSVDPTDEHLVSFMKGIGEINVSAPTDHVARERWNARRRCLRGLSAVAEHVDDVARLANFRNPVLLVHGRETALFHQRINERLAFHLPCSEHLLLPGGHSSVLTATGEFLAELRLFLARCYPE
jgi:pimeloyl-ACP methyl ester carboxylesterase